MHAQYHYVFHLLDLFICQCHSETWTWYSKEFKYIMCQRQVLHICECTVQNLGELVDNWVSNYNLEIWSQKIANCGMKRLHFKDSNHIPNHFSKVLLDWNCNTIELWSCYILSWDLTSSYRHVHSFCVPGGYLGTIVPSIFTVSNPPLESWL